MAWITRSISNRLFTVSLGGLIVLLSIAIGSITRINSSLDNHQTLVVNMSHAMQVERLNTLFKTQVQEWKNVLLRGSDSSNREKYWQRFQKKQNEIQTETLQLLKALQIDEAQNKLDKFQRVHKLLEGKYRSGYNAYVDSQFNASVGDKAVKGIDREPSKLLDETAKLIREIVATESKNAAEFANSVSAMAIPSVVVVAIFVLIGMYWLVNRMVVAPLKKLQSHAKELGQGNFVNTMNLSRDDEIGELAVDLETMKKNISNILREVSNTTSSLSQTANELDQAADELTGNTSNAERNLDSTSAGMTEMATVASEVATCANDANSAANLVEKSATGGLSTMNKTISAINELAGQVESVTETMAKLEHDSANVGSVLDVIKGIAEQTNLLALNAAIEAARAGEQGRGFAVVADEVRTLAQRTQESTEEINQIIKALQQAATDAARMMDDNRERTLATVELASNTGESIQQIVSEVEQIRTLSNQIFTATEEQKTAANTIDENITSVATVASETHHLAQNTRTIAQDLSTVSERLNQAVGQFKI